MQLHAYPYERRAADRCLHRHRRDARGGLAGRRASTGSTSRRPPTAAPSSSPTPSAAGRCARNKSHVDHLPHGRQRALVARQHGAARRRRPHRPLLHRLRHQARRRGRPRARRLLGGAARPCPRRWRRTRRSGGPSSQSTQRAARASLEWFEDLATYVGPAAAPVRLQPAHPQPPRHPRQPAAARPGLRRGRGARSSAVPTGTPPMFTPFRLRGLTLRNRVVVSAMDMYSADGRRPRRLPPRPPRRPCTGRRRPGHDRDGVRHRRRAASPRAAPASGPTGQAEAWRRDHRLRARPGPGHRDRRPARPLRPQGLDPADVGGHRRAAAGRQLAARRRLPAPVPARRQPGPARADARPNSPRYATSSRTAARRAARRRLRPPRTPLRPRLPALRLPLPAHQPPHGRLRRRRSPAASASRWRSSTRYAQVWPRGAAHDRPYLGHGLGRGRHHAPRTPSRSPRAFAAHGADADRRLHRPGRRRRAPRLRPLVPDPVRRPDPQRPWASRSSPSAPSPPGTTSTHCSWRAAPTCARWPGRICTTRTGRCTRRPSRATRARAPPGRRRTVRAAARPPTGPHGRAQAARCQHWGAEPPFARASPAPRHSSLVATSGRPAPAVPGDRRDGRDHHRHHAHAHGAGPTTAHEAPRR